MQDKIPEIIRELGKYAAQKQRGTVTAGFDGFVDSIVRVVREVDSQNCYTFFEEMPQLGEYLIDKKGKSCSIELDEQLVKLGGNMPIFANALGSLGVEVNCIGAMGFPETHPVFKGISSNCTLVSVAEPGYCTALEFMDGKVMLASNRGINTMSWEGIKEIVGVDRLRQLFADSSIISMLNWSELLCTTSIWEGIVTEVLPEHTPDKQQTMFFDLSDCSKRDSAEVLHALRLIRKFNRNYRVILSLNENEAGHVFKVLSPPFDSTDPDRMGDWIFKSLEIDMLVIHPVRYSIAWSHSGKCRVDGFYIERPKLSTGGGDNFNAGLCLAQLLGLDLEASLVMAGAVSGCYVKNGCSPTVHELSEFLTNWKYRLQKR